MRTYIVTFMDGTAFPVTAPSWALVRQVCREAGWIARFGAITYID